MRNDVKLGFAIGGVLLAVLVVYVLVVPGSGAKKKVALNAADKDASGKVTLEPVTPAKALPQAQPVSAPPQTFSPGAAHSRDIIAEAGTASGGSLPTKPAPTDPFAGNTASDGAGASSSGNHHAGADSVELAKTGSKSNPNLPDWNRILNDQPTLIAQTPVPVVPAADENPTASRGPAGTSPSSVDPGQPATPSHEMVDPAPDRIASGAEQPLSTGASADAPAPGGGHIHTVAAGETFSSISASAYGSANFYPAIMRANPSIDPQHLKPGMKITLPDVSQVKPSASSPGAGAASVQLASAKAPQTIDPTKQYRVQPGDSLYRIAVRLYGKGAYSDKIFELNQQTMGGDETRLRPGQILQLPEPPTQAGAVRR